MKYKDNKNYLSLLADFIFFENFLVPPFPPCLYPYSFESSKTKTVSPLGRVYRFPFNSFVLNFFTIANIQL